MNKATGVLDPLEVVMRYHQETKHHFSRYARAPGSMDWAGDPPTAKRACVRWQHLDFSSKQSSRGISGSDIKVGAKATVEG